MLCGVMEQSPDGKSIENTGKVAEQDQSRTFKNDECVRVDGANTTVVPCEEDHSWQVISTVNLSQQFPDAFPSIDAQNEYLNGVCTEQARNYLGGDDALYKSTLTPFWTTQQQQSWDAGSRQVNCALTFANKGGGFAHLNGDVRKQFTIDGQPPTKMPERNPLRPEAGGSPAPQPPA